MANQRRAVRPSEAEAPRIEARPGLVTIRSLLAAREVLRANGSTTQAGFTAEFIPQGYLKHHPILMSDGPLHDEQRRKVGRFFAPRVVSERYGTIMKASAEHLTANAVAAGECDVDELALWHTVEVTRHVVGLTESSVRRMAKRLVSFFNQPPFDITKPDLGRTRRQWAQAAANGILPIVRFYFADVRPAIRKRRKRRSEDIISHLLDEGYSNVDILVESLTYGTAGMVTTREFITMALWHLLSTPALRERYQLAGLQERVAILEEIIRLEPVVGHLYRRVTEPLEIHDGEESLTLAAGDLVDINVRAANADASVVGEDPLAICPGRSLPRGVHTAGLSFSDGAHRCPGQALAILETDALIMAMLAHDPTIAAEPELGWDDLIAGYSLRGLRIRFPSPTRPKP